jgi:hypothetical protein
MLEGRKALRHSCLHQFSESFYASSRPATARRFIGHASPSDERVRVCSGYSIGSITKRKLQEEVMKGVTVNASLQTVSAVSRLGKALRVPAAAFAALLMSGLAMAFTAPAVGSFGYDVYDIVVNQILNGPIGFIGGVILIVFGATQIIKNWMMTIMCVIAGTVLIRAEDLVITLGAMVG